MKQRKFVIHGKTRIVRNIKEDTDCSFFAWYAGCSIYVWIDDEDETYAICKAPDGGYIVDGYMRKKWDMPMTIEEGIQSCLENIFHSEKPNPR